MIDEILSSKSSLISVYPHFLHKERSKEIDLQITDFFLKIKKEKRYLIMLKITIHEDDSAKIYYGSGVQMKQLKARGLEWYECTIFVKNSFVKSGSILLHPTDTVLIEETER